jgi:hypothetical protein
MHGFQKNCHEIFNFSFLALVIFPGAPGFPASGISKNIFDDIHNSGMTLIVSLTSAVNEKK